MNPFIRPKWALLVPRIFKIHARESERAQELRRICIQIAELNVIQQFHVNVAIVAAAAAVVVGHRTMTKPKGINRTFAEL